MYIPDNYDAYRKYEADRERDEYLNNKITDAETTVGDVISLLEECEPTEEISRAIKELSGLLQRL
jgi:hypothetical protein